MFRVKDRLGLAVPFRVKEKVFCDCASVLMTTANVGQELEMVYGS